MNKTLLSGASILLLLLTSCGGKTKGTGGMYPENFSTMGDTERVAYVMQTSSPDSVARFICSAVLGDIPGVKLDSLGVVTNYAYSVYNTEDQVKFGDEYENVVENLPLAKKMKLLSLAGTEDPQGLGYQLGLDYMSQIRDRNMTAEEVAGELQEFKKACGEDKDTYRRFVIGFKTVLRVDNGKDVKKEIYDRFINMSEE